jgi:hypothetical protein
MLIFLSGNISGINDFDKFKSIRRKLEKDHNRVLSIVDIISNPINNCLNDKDYKIARLKYLLKSDKVIFMKGYEKSALAIREYAIAEYLNTPIEVYYDKDFD